VIPEAGRAGNKNPALFDQAVIVKNERALKKCIGNECLKNETTESWKEPYQHLQLFPHRELSY
jgi:hypothetical protein